MAWTAPSTWVSGAILTAAQLNQQLRDNMLELAPFFSAWTSWTPTMTQTGTLTFTITSAKYIKVGRLVIAYFDLTGFSGGTNAAAIVMNFGSGGTALPSASTGSSIHGQFRWFDAGNTNYAGTIVGTSTTSVSFYEDGNGNPLGGGALASAGDVFQGQIIYEAAS